MQKYVTLLPKQLHLLVPVHDNPQPKLHRYAAKMALALDACVN